MDISNTKRSLGVERLYSLGDYKNIKFTDVISDLPVEFLENPHAVDLIRTLQVTQCDTAFNNYVIMRKKLGDVGCEELAILLEELRQNTLKELKDIFSVVSK